MAGVPKNRQGVSRPGDTPSSTDCSTRDGERRSPCPGWRRDCIYDHCTGRKPPLLEHRLKCP